MTAAEKKIDYGLIPVFDVAKNLFNRRTSEDAMQKVSKCGHLGSPFPVE